MCSGRNVSSQMRQGKNTASNVIILPELVVGFDLEKPSQVGNEIGRMELLSTAALEEISIPGLKPILLRRRQFLELQGELHPLVGNNT